METALYVQVGLETLVYPAVAAAGCFWLAGKLVDLEAGAGAGLAAGYLTVHWLAIGLPPTPPVETTQWLFVLALLAGVAALMPPRRPAGRVVAGLLLIAAVVVTLNPMWRYHWSPGGAAWRVGAAALGLLFVWRMTTRLAKRRPGPWAPAALLATAAAAAAMLGLSATTLLSQLAAGATASLAVISVLGLVLRIGPARWVPVWLVLFGSLLLNGYYYAQLSGWSVLALTLALPAAWLSQLGRERGRWKTAAVAVVAVALITGPAVGLAASDFLSQPDYDDYEDY